MVLVSKLRGSSSQTSTGSFFTKVNSILGRSSSSTALQVIDPATASSSGYLKPWEKETSSSSLWAQKKFDERDMKADQRLDRARLDDAARLTDNSSWARPNGKRPTDQRLVMDRPQSDASPASSAAKQGHCKLSAECSNPVTEMVLLSDFEADDHSLPLSSIASSTARKLVLPVSTCGGTPCNDRSNAPPHDSASVAASSSMLDTAEPSSHDSLMNQRGFAFGESLPGNIPDSPSKSQTVSQSELPGRLWDPADPPAMANPAWQMKRDTEVLAPLGHRTRFPAKLPPLSSGLGKSLKSLGGFSGSSTVVLDVVHVTPPKA